MEEIKRRRIVSAGLNVSVSQKEGDIWAETSGRGETRWWYVWGTGIQAEETAAAKALRQELQIRVEAGVARGD